MGFDADPIYCCGCGRDLDPDWSTDGLCEMCESAFDNFEDE